MTVDSGNRRVGERTLWLWQGQAAYLGLSFQLDTHSTPVQCFVLGVDEKITVRTPDGGRWQRRSVLIPARTAHKLESSGRVLFYYLDPRSAAAARLRASMREPTIPVATGHRDEAALTAHLNQPGQPDPRELRRIIAGPETPATIDERIRAVMNTIVNDPAGRTTAAELAADLGISTSRFLHLFSANAGTSLRRYRLWARLLSVAGAVADGIDLTRAAADAGFASASHFSDTFRTLFGLTATEVLAQGMNIVLVPDTERTPTAARLRR
ncbi:AraC family transcriptional regulator [Nocardia ninae]|uniref:Transcriptional regulator n=1 Tax=Nocardia ninae NBRC 108245 TaxID=1210091 RepID=A0A511MB87_9NOCA|nr:AraC family transcriptional regulator [Nocardia ninae]GEM37925.1 transcriptional regulator [Nocardia ninae NBRC 108245]